MPPGGEAHFDAVSQPLHRHLLADCLDCAGIPVDQRHLGTFAAEQHAGCVANSTAATGDDRDLACKSLGGHGWFLTSLRYDYRLTSVTALWREMRPAGGLIDVRMSFRKVRAGFWMEFNRSKRMVEGMRPGPC